MARAVRGNRLAAAFVMAVVPLAGLAFLTACTAPAPHADQSAVKPTITPTIKPTERHVPAQPSRPARPTPQPPASTPPPAVTPGALGTYQVGQREVTFVEPAHVGPTGERLGQRTLATKIYYPAAARSARSGKASGPYPLLVFAPGFLQCDTTYADLLEAWAGAGYVVAAVNFPRTDCSIGAAAYEPDLVNQPQDVSYVLTRLLEMNARSHTVLSGLVNTEQIAAAGQSDGGDTVAALAANTCCADHRFKAVAVLSGAEWPPMPGKYFAGSTPPMLFVQGNADTINPPWTSAQLYTADHARDRYYLDLFGATHMIPYSGTNPVERLVSRVTVNFFDWYVLGQPGAAAKMTHYGNIHGISSLADGGEPAPLSTCRPIRCSPARHVPVMCPRTGPVFRGPADRARCSAGPRTGPGWMLVTKSWRDCLNPPGPGHNCHTSH